MSKDKLPTGPATFFVSPDRDMSLEEAKKILRETKRLSLPETPVVSVSDATFRATRMKIVFDSSK
jgi:hypothetical protein